MRRQEEANSEGAFGNGSGARGRTRRTGSRLPRAKTGTARTRLHSQARRTPATGHHRTRTVIPPIGDANSSGDACQCASTGAWSACVKRCLCASWTGTAWATSQQVTRLQPSAPATSIDQVHGLRRHSLTRISLPGHPRPTARGLVPHDDILAGTTTCMRTMNDIRAIRASFSDAPASETRPACHPAPGQSRSQLLGAPRESPRRGGQVFAVGHVLAAAGRDSPIVSGSGST